MTALEAVCQIIQTELALEAGRVWLWNQKINMPKDDGVFVVVQVVSSKAFGISNRVNPVNGNEVQGINMFSTLQIDIMSRSTEALDRKEEVVLALGSVYAQQMQELHSFKIAQLPTGFVNLSQEDGPAIPYRFTISVNVQYSIKKEKPAAYFDDFDEASTIIDP